MKTRPSLVRIRGVGVRQRTAWFLWLFLVAVVPGGSAQDTSSTPDVEAVVARMAQARAENRARFRPYTATRDYKLFGTDGQNPKSQVTADVAFVPPNVVEYSIEQTVGSGWGARIVRRVLANEAKIAKEYAATEISAANYDFRLLREEDVVEVGQRCYVLELLPKRKDKHLLRGTIWVDANTYLLRRVEGEPAKSPSWWVREMRLVLLYGNVGGMWLQTASEATANVRIAGQYRLVSRDVKYKIGDLVAAISPIQTSISVGESAAKDWR